jgi:hypothetical protein
VTGVSTINGSTTPSLTFEGPGTTGNVAVSNPSSGTYEFSVTQNSVSFNVNISSSGNTAVVAQTQANLYRFGALRYMIVTSFGLPLNGTGATRGYITFDIGWAAGDAPVGSDTFTGSGYAQDEQAGQAYFPTLLVMQANGANNTIFTFVNVNTGGNSNNGEWDGDTYDFGPTCISWIAA